MTDKSTNAMAHVSTHNTLKYKQKDFVNRSLNVAIREIQKDERYMFRIIALVKINEKTWKAEGTGITITFDDPENAEVLHMMIRNEGEKNFS